MMSTRTMCSLHVSRDTSSKDSIDVCLLIGPSIIRSTTCTIGMWEIGTSSSYFMINLRFHGDILVICSTAVDV